MRTLYRVWERAREWPTGSILTVPGRVRLCRTPYRSSYGSKFAQYSEAPPAEPESHPTGKRRIEKVSSRFLNLDAVSSQTDGRSGSGRPFLCKSFKMNLLQKNRALFSPGESDRIQPTWMWITLTRRRVGALKLGFRPFQLISGYFSLFPAISAYFRLFQHQPFQSHSK